jgi:septin family protein
MKKISDITNIIPIIAKGEKNPLHQMIKIKSLMVEKLNEYKIITYNVESAISVNIIKYRNFVMTRNI